MSIARPLFTKPCAGLATHWDNFLCFMFSFMLFLTAVVASTVCASGILGYIHNINCDL